MDIGLREWLVIGGLILIGLIILDGWRRMNGNRNRLRMDIDPNVADLPDEPVRAHNPELPNGGARLVGQDTLFADLEKERDAHDAPELAEQESDPLFDSPAIEADGRIEPAFGVDSEPATLAPMKPERSEPSHAHDEHTLRDFDDNSEFDELLGPARVVSLKPESETVLAETEIPEALEEVRAFVDREPSPEIEPVAGQLHYEADSLPQQDPEPLFPTLDGFDEPVSLRDKPQDVKDSAPVLAMDEVLSAPRIVESRPNPAAAASSAEQDKPEALPPSAQDAARVSPASVADAPEPAVESAVAATTAKVRNPDQPQVAAVSSNEPELDLDKPITLLLDDSQDDSSESVPSLFTDEAVSAGEKMRRNAKTREKTVAKSVPRTPPESAETAAEPVPETQDLFAERTTPEKITNPDSVLAITVLAAEDRPIPGGKLLSLVSACGMRFGDMDIFHRFEDGLDEGAVQFSMANAIKPGTFDLDLMGDTETRGLTFFMSMDEPRDVMNAFECMLATAETVAKHMGAELLDENRSVLRPQTKEHYRQRIRDFGMRNLSRRAH